jgi:hypothetical protein
LILGLVKTRLCPEWVGCVSPPFDPSASASKSLGFFVSLRGNGGGGERSKGNVRPRLGDRVNGLPSQNKRHPVDDPRSSGNDLTFSFPSFLLLKVKQGLVDDSSQSLNLSTSHILLYGNTPSHLN